MVLELGQRVCGSAFFPGQNVVFFVDISMCLFGVYVRLILSLKKIIIRLRIW